ncbi:MAG: DUF1838 family protein [Rhodospirillaceae bacterium]|nr:DUF1838 family protein [Rhodospirillaceae bacterium]
MDQQSFTRRGALAGAAAAGTLMAAGPASAATLDVNDPKNAARIRAKIMGSTREEAAMTYLRINVYAFFNEGTLKPLYTLSNLNIRRWSPQADGSFKAKVFESGTYFKFDTDEPIDMWENPFTGETRIPGDFQNGPLNLTILPDGSISTGAEATLKPKPLRSWSLGDNFFLQQASGFSYPNPWKPSEWPVESAGETSHWDSHYLFSAKLSDVANDDVANVPATVQLQNLVTWAPWLGMGQRPGRTWGRGVGAKIKSLDEVPKAALAEFRKKTPMIFETETWTALRDETQEYRNKLKAKR